MPGPGSTRRRSSRHRRSPRRRAWLSRRRRNQICLLVLVLGLANFAAYTISYAVLGGDAHNGYCKLVPANDQSMTAIYVIRGHHLDDVAGREREVSRSVWVYSYIHSMTVPLTSGAVILSMLILARPHIIATMRGGMISGRLFLGVVSGIVVLLSLGVLAAFVMSFVRELQSVSRASVP